MRIQRLAYFAAGLAFILATMSAGAQGTFQNLGFESANLPAIPHGQYGGSVSSLDALPYWTCFLGTNQVTQVLHNNGTLGNASIDILGPNWSSVVILEGQYTVVLQPGANGSGYDVGASISQTGLVPADAQSLQFRARLYSPVSVSLGGQVLSIVPLGSSTNYILYGANIPLSVAGQVTALTVTALPAPNTTDYFDSFVFSSSSVPEPGVFALSALGALVLGWRVRGRLRVEGVGMGFQQEVAERTEPLTLTLSPSDGERETK